MYDVPNLPYVVAKDIAFMRVVAVHTRKRRSIVLTISSLSFRFAWCILRFHKTVLDRADQWLPNASHNMRLEKRAIIFPSQI